MRTGALLAATRRSAASTVRMAVLEPTMRSAGGAERLDGAAGGSTTVSVRNVTGDLLVLAVRSNPGRLGLASGVEHGVECGVERLVERGVEHRASAGVPGGGAPDQLARRRPD
jgi:hypothetical protein